MFKWLTVFAFVIVSAIALGQSQTVTLNAPIPPALANLNTTVVGGLGQSTYYYHIIANYPIGSIISKGFAVANAPTTITSGNYIRLNWNILPGATTYDILRTTVPRSFTAGSSGSCSACILVLGLTVTTYNDQSPTLTLPYTLNAPVGSSVQFYLNNRDYIVPRLIYSNTNGPQSIVDFSNSRIYSGNIFVNDNNFQSGFSILQNSITKAGLFTSVDGTLFEIGRYNDAGAYLDDYLFATRATGVVTIPSGLVSQTFLQQQARTTDPGCTTVADIGKFWFDNTTTTTAAKKCMNVAGSLTWVAF